MINLRLYLTNQENMDLKKLLLIVEDPNKLSGQRRIALAKIEKLIQISNKRSHNAPVKRKLQLA